MQSLKWSVISFTEKGAELAEKIKRLSKEQQLPCEIHISWQKTGGKSERVDKGAVFPKKCNYFYRSMRNCSADNCPIS